MMPFLVLATGCTAGILLYAFWARHGMGIRGEWAWGIVREPRTEALGWPILLSGLMVLGLAWAGRRGPADSGRRGWAGVGALVLALFLLQMAVGGLGRGGNVETVFASFPPANSYFLRALEVRDTRGYLKGYQQEIEQGPFRVQLSTHPPGSVLYYVAFLEAAERWPSAARAVRDTARGWAPEEGAYQIPEIGRTLEAMVQPEQEGAAWAAAVGLRLAASLAAIPAYQIARMELPAVQALPLAAASSLVPALFLFSPHPDQLFPGLTLAFFWLVLAGLRGRSVLAAAASGFVLFAGLFFSLSFLLPLAAAALLIALARARAPARGDFRLGLAALAGFLLPVFLFYVLYDHNLVTVWRACAAQNDEFNLHSGRTYWKWLMFNPLDLAIFAGAPAFLLFWSEWGRVLDRWWLHGEAGRPGAGGHDLANPGPARPQDSSAGPSDQPGLPLLLVSLGVSLILLNLSGKNLGEVGRLWMMVMPLMLLSAAGSRRRGNGGLEPALLLVMITLQLVQTIGLRMSVDALGLFFGSRY
ncbi:MAG: hypothetical protein HYU36_23950 [Planctomycetes bacterium]|nr:hypothetical protein [Planctomycetota bacterium]